MYADACTHCCAISEFEGLNHDNFTAGQALRTIGEHFLNRHRDNYDSEWAAFAHIAMFQKYCSEVQGKKVGMKNARALEKLIKDNDLGTWTEGPAKRNPNSGFMIVPIFFTPKKEKFRDYLRSEFGLIPREPYSYCW